MFQVSFCVCRVFYFSKVTFLWLHGFLASVLKVGFDYCGLSGLVVDPTWKPTHYLYLSFLLLACLLTTAQRKETRQQNCSWQMLQAYRLFQKSDSVLVLPVACFFFCWTLTAAVLAGNIYECGALHWWRNKLSWCLGGWLLSSKRYLRTEKA